ncbi:N-acetyltransferase [Hoylesella nanceiensis]|uniref:N-acetyltransferase n=1 Tax=Hoylesella nanceiensis TaxID=425941 RepID=UPI0028EE209E|nr:N-acetyltransferase [Hoylesella nanceiensis]
MIRKAIESDLLEIKNIVDKARELMKSSGNINQWVDGYPSIDVLLSDIRSGNAYLLLRENKAVAYFAMIDGPEPTYNLITKGSWLNDDSYGVLHRVASNGEAKGVFKEILLYASEHYSNIRIDTHHDNKIMQRLLEQNGFVYCGIIFLGDGSPRLAYQRIKG